MDEADLSFEAPLQEFERDRVSRSRFEMMQSHEGVSEEPYEGVKGVLGGSICRRMGLFYVCMRI